MPTFDARACRRRGGSRWTDFHVLPADGVDRDTVLKLGELIEAIGLGPLAPHSAYVKVRERVSYEYASSRRQRRCSWATAAGSTRPARVGRIAPWGPTGQSAGSRVFAPTIPRDQGDRRRPRCSAPRRGQRLQARDRARRAARVLMTLRSARERAAGASPPRRTVPRR
jgi:hypothetical protein